MSGSGHAQHVVVSLLTQRLQLSMALREGEAGQVSRKGVLIVAPFLPWPANFGGAQRIHALACELQRDLDVTLLAPMTPTEEHHLQALGAHYDVVGVPAPWSLRFPTSRARRVQQLRTLLSRQSIAEAADHHVQVQMQQVIDRILQTRFIDLLRLETPWVAGLHTTPTMPVILDAQNVEWQLLQRIARTTPSLGKRVYNAAEFRKLRRAEIAAWRAASAVTVTSAPDAASIAPYTQRPPVVVPNGVAIGTRDHALAPRPRSEDVIFVGALRHAPNADAVRWYLDHVHPLVRAAYPLSRLLVVGADPPAWLTQLARPDVVVTGTVADVQPWLAGAGVAVLPLLSGGGTRIKALEAFAAGVPIVSTAIGVEGIDVRSDEHLLLADTPDTFAAAVLATLDPGNAAAVQGRVLAAHALVSQQYSWERAALPLRALAADLLDRR